MGSIVQRRADTHALHVQSCAPMFLIAVLLWYPPHPPPPHTPYTRIVYILPCTCTLKGDIKESNGIISSVKNAFKSLTGSGKDADQGDEVQGSAHNQRGEGTEAAGGWTHVGSDSRSTRGNRADEKLDNAGPDSARVG